MDTGIGIRAVATCVGEMRIAAADLAAAHGFSTEVVERWIGPMEICASNLSSTELGAEAGKRCLAQASMDPKEVDAVVWVSTRGLAHGISELHVQALLGTENAFTYHAGTTCSEMISALLSAHAMIAGGYGIERVLVVSGEQYGGVPRTLGMSPKVQTQPIFSDVGGALLLARGDGPKLVGFGSASSGQHWDYLWRVASEGDRAPGLPTALQVYLDGLPVMRRAIERSLACAGISREQVDHVVVTRESTKLGSIVRHMGLSEDKALVPVGGPTHSGAGDVLVGLEELMGGRASPGQHVLLGARTVGMMRCAVIRW